MTLHVTNYARGGNTWLTILSYLMIRTQTRILHQINPYKIQKNKIKYVRPWQYVGWNETRLRRRAVLGGNESRWASCTPRDLAHFAREQDVLSVVSGDETWWAKMKKERMYYFHGVSLPLKGMHDRLQRHIDAIHFQNLLLQLCEWHVGLSGDDITEVLSASKMTHSTEKLSMHLDLNTAEQTWATKFNWRWRRKSVVAMLSTQPHCPLADPGILTYRWVRNSLKGHWKGHLLDLDGNESAHWREERRREDVKEGTATSTLQQSKLYPSRITIL